MFGFDFFSVVNVKSYNYLVPFWRMYILRELPQHCHYVTIILKQSLLVVISAIHN